MWAAYQAQLNHLASLAQDPADSAAHAALASAGMAAWQALLTAQIELARMLSYHIQGRRNEAAQEYDRLCTRHAKARMCDIASAVHRLLGL